MIISKPANIMAFLSLSAIVIFATYYPAFALKGYQSNTLIVFLSLVFLVFAFLSYRNQNTEPYPLSSISFSFLLFLGWVILGRFYTVDQDMSMSTVLIHVGGIALLLGLSLRIREEEHLKFFLGLVLFCAGFMSAIAILQQFNIYQEIIPAATKQMSTGLYGHRNILATYLLLHFPLAIYFYVSSQTRTKKVIFGIISILIALALIFSRSRGGQLVLGIELLSVLIYFVREKNYRKIRDLIIGGVLITVVYFGLFSLVKVSQVKPLVEHINLTQIAAEKNRKAWVETPPSIANIFTGDKSPWHSLANRLVFWKTGWGIFKDYWLTGTGPWTFELLFPVYQDKEITEKTFSIMVKEGTKFGDHSPPHSHNIFIQTATETGLIGLGLLVGFLITLYSRGIYLLRKAPPEGRSFVFFLILSVTGFLIHNLIEYNWFQIQFIYSFIILLFAIDFLDRKYSPRKSSLGKVNSVIHSSVMTAFIIVATLSTMNYYKYQDLIYEKIISGTSMTNFNELTNEAKGYCPSCGWPALEMAKHLISQYRLTQNNAVLVSAETELKEVAFLTPFNYKHFIYLAEIRAFQGNWEGAKKLYEQAFKNMNMKQFHACRVLALNPDKC